MDDVQEATAVEAILRALPADATEEDIVQATRGYRRSAVSAAMVGIRYQGGEGGGASSLTGLDDVAGPPGPGKAPVGDETGTDFTLLPVVTQTDLDATLDAVARVEWRQLTLLDGWANSGPPYAPARYRLTLNNVVYFQGRISRTEGLRNSDAPRAITTVGPDARPGGDLVFMAPTGAIQNIARIIVTAAGEVMFGGLLASSNPAATDLNLPGIVYSIEGEDSFAVQSLRR